MDTNIYTYTAPNVTRITYIKKFFYFLNRLVLDNFSFICLYGLDILYTCREKSYNMVGFVPKRSPIHLRTVLNVAWPQWSDESWNLQTVNLLSCSVETFIWYINTNFSIFNLIKHSFIFDYHMLIRKIVLSVYSK